MNYSKKYYIPVTLPDKNSPVLAIKNPDEKKLIRSGKFIPPATSCLSITNCRENLISPHLNDYQTCPYPVISSKLKTCLDEFLYLFLDGKNINGLTYIKSTISINDSRHDGFYLLMITNIIHCLNESKSEIRKTDGNITKIIQLFLDENELAKKPLNERLIFKLGEKKTVFLFHENIVNFLQKHSLTGVKFIPVSEWSSTILFHI